MSHQDESLWVREDADRGKWREAEQARQNRREIQRALSNGEVSRRELVKWGLYTSAGVIAPIGGLSPFVRSAHGQAAAASTTFHTGAGGSGVPTGLPHSPTFGVAPFSSPMYRFDILPQYYVPGSEAAKYPNPAIPQSTTALSPTPTVEANTTQQPVNPQLVNGTTGLTGPIEGRPPGSIWAHQKFSEFPPQIEIQIIAANATTNGEARPAATSAAPANGQQTPSYAPGVASNFNSGINASSPIPPAFNPNFPNQTNNSAWMYQGTFPPKLMISRYGFPALVRHYNDLPYSVTQNGVNNFGKHTTTVHEHNAHHGSENDGFTGAYFFPGEFYDYHYPWTLAGFTTINTGATMRQAGAPNGNGGITQVPGDWHETMSTHWFHDHMFTYTDQNIYKGLAAMNNIYSALDRGNEGLDDGVNLMLPSGTTNDFANLEYDINLLFADLAWDKNGQLDMDTAQFDGFLGDQMSVNLCWKPFLEVYARKYRFRLLNRCVSRFLVFALSDSSELVYIANDGNLLPSPVYTNATGGTLPGRPANSLDQLGIAERYDIVIDFSRYSAGATLYLVNLEEETNGKSGPSEVNILTVAEAMQGVSKDPAVGPCLQFRVLGAPPTKDVSVIPATMIPNPSEGTIKNSRTFVFGHDGALTQDNPVSTYDGNGTNGGVNGTGVGTWGIATYNSDARNVGGIITSAGATVSHCNIMSNTIGNGNDDANCQLLADFGRISASPAYNLAETWTLVNGGTWDHPVHVHFEEGHILARATNGVASTASAIAVPAWEQGRKDVYRIRPGDAVTFFIQFRDWGGMFMEHCHNMMHEDNAMLLRWEINGAGGVFLNPLPTPIPEPTGVTFEHPDEILAGAFPPNNSTTNGYPGGPPGPNDN
jgi:manganese oxidase